MLNDGLEAVDSLAEAALEQPEEVEGRKMAEGGEEGEEAPSLEEAEVAAVGTTFWVPSDWDLKVSSSRVALCRNF